MSADCCSPEPVVEAPPRTRRVVLAGNPNAGKSTVFNLLTGLHQHVGNYAGVTVEKKRGRLTGADDVEVIDLPGTYSLNPKSLDERIAYDVMTGRLDGEPSPDIVVCVVDATNLERNLYLATQIIDLGLSTVVVLNMMDAVEAAGQTIDTDALAEALGVPVVPMTASRGKGLAELRAVLTGPLPEPGAPDWSLEPALDEAVASLAEHLGTFRPDLPAQRRTGESLRALVSEAVLAFWEHEEPAFYRAAHDAREALTEQGTAPTQAETMGRYAWLHPLAERVTARIAENDEPSLSDRIDAVLTHRIAGPILFLFILLLIFQAIFSWATPAMELIETGMTELGLLVRRVLPPGLVADLLVDGVIAGVGNVLVFLPQILLLFFFLGLMESTGYMARTAFIMDRLMRRVGLSGRSVVPLLSGFACAVPAIMAARTLENQRDRLVTIMVVPLMSCSARLPVYTLFIAAFIPATPVVGPIDYQGLAMFALYLLGTVTAFIAAWVLRRRVFKGNESFFVLELPPYRAPQWRLVTYRMFDRGKVFVQSAGKIIFVFSVILWFLAAFPRVDPSPALQQRRDAAEARALLIQTGDAPAAAQQRIESELQAMSRAEAAYRLEHSFIGRFGHAIEPVMRPLGFDWKLSAGLVAAFAAREVIISALGTIYSVADADENSLALRDRLRQDRDPETGQLVYTPLVAASLLVFFVLAMQCMSTLAIARRELNSWLWPVVMWTYMTGLAYLASLLVYQGGRLLGLG